MGEMLSKENMGAEGSLVLVSLVRVDDVEEKQEEE